MNEPFFEIKLADKKDNYSKFVISPLEQGYGDTLGNSLRRVMLTSLPGAAITSVKISGVKHQFSSLKGMKEDVVEFLLNLKKVRLSYEGDKPTKAVVSATGPGVVTAKDIKADVTVKIANPELVLASLNKGVKLEAKLEIETGVGYSVAEGRLTNEIGLIPLDALFSPITRVNYKVEETRVGRVTNYDKLILEVWTNGLIDPQNAVVKAAEILVSYYKQIINPKVVEKVEVESKVDDLGPIGKLSVEEIGLPTRVANALLKAGYETVENLVKAKRANLVKVRNLGEKSVKIIDAALGEKGMEISG
jgi:DNA-directed RNA polymerase, alpha subunit, bacterial and chloroplast-type